MTGERKIATEDGRVSDPMLNDWLFYDGQHTSYAKCSGGCQHSLWDGEARAYHVACADGMTSSSLRGIMDVSAFTYEPLLLELEARKNRFRLLSQGFVCRALPQLPAEICDSITELCLRRMSVAHTWRLVSMPEEKYRLSMTSNIWAGFTKLEGIAYLSSLSNRPNDRHNILIFAPDPTEPTKTIYLVEDYLGVRKVLFRPPEASGEGLQDVWWRMVSLRNSNIVVVKSDVVSLSHFLLACTLLTVSRVSKFAASLLKTGKRLDLTVQ